MAAGMGSSGSCEETLAQLDALQAAERSRNASDLGRLTALVGGLGTGTEIAPELGVPTPGSRPAEFRDRPETVAYPLLPQRTTHGGPFGASIIERVAASVRKGNEW